MKLSEFLATYSVAIPWHIARRSHKAQDSDIYSAQVATAGYSLSHIHAMRFELDGEQWVSMPPPSSSESSLRIRTYEWMRMNPTATAKDIKKTAIEWGVNPSTVMAYRGLFLRGLRFGRGEKQQ